MLVDIVSNPKNTFKDSEFFKVVVFSATKENSLRQGSWLTNSNNLWRGFYTCPFLNTKLIVSLNWLGSDITSIDSTISSEAILIFLENSEEWEKIRPEVLKLYSIIPTKVIVYNHEDAKKFAMEIKGVAYQNNNAEELKKILNHSDTNEYEKLATYFKKFDADKSGFIDLAELPSLAKALDEDPKSEKFKNSMLVFDVNKDNKISLEEFIVFWKIGRQNTATLAKIYTFELAIEEFAYKFLNYENFLKEIKVLQTKNDLKTNKININIKTKDQVKIRSRIECRLTIGGPTKEEAVKSFISKFTDNLDPVQENWVNLSVFLKSETIDSKTAKTYLEEFRTNLINFAEKNLISGLSGFMNNFINFKSYNRECSTTVLFRLKFDIESLMKDACKAIVKVVEALSDKEKSFDLNLKLFSEDCLKDLFKNKESLKGLLKNSEITIDSTCIKSRLKAFMLNTNKSYQSLLGLFQILFAPNDLKMDFNGPITELIDETSNNILNTSLAPFETLISFIKSNLNPILLKSMKRLEIGFNLFGIFFNVQIFSDTLWEDEIKVVTN